MILLILYTIVFLSTAQMLQFRPILAENNNDIFLLVIKFRVRNSRRTVITINMFILF